MSSLTGTSTGGGPSVGGDDLGLEVDDARRGLGAADGGLSVVDGVGDLGGAVRGGNGDLRSDEQLVGTEMHRLQVDDALDAGDAFERGGDPLLDVDRGRLPEQQALGLDAEHDGD